MSDAQGQSLLNFLDTPLLVGDPEGRVVFANDAFVRQLTPDGVAPRGDPLASLFAGGGREAVLASVAEVCTKGESVKFRIREGGRGYLAMASPIHAEESRVGVVILLTDEPSLDTRLLDFHREIQEPLDETAACLDELLEASAEQGDERFRDAVERGAISLRRARKWSAELHRVLRGASGGKNDDVLQPGRVLRQVASRLSAEFESAQVELSVLINPEVSQAKGESTMLETILVRLLRQRLSHAPAGAAITLLARNVGGAMGPGVLISVADPNQRSNADDTADDDPPEYTRMVREIVAVLGAEITTVVEPPAGRATAIRLPCAQV